jgi:hypothetical protein
LGEVLRMPAGQVARLARLARREAIPCVTMPDGTLLFERVTLMDWLQTRRTGPATPEGAAHAG